MLFLFVLEIHIFERKGEIMLIEIKHATTYKTLQKLF